MKKYRLFFFTILISSVANAQLSKEQTEKYITNGSIRNWQFKTYKKSLGGSECSGDGQLFTFNKDGTLQRKRCMNGKKDFKALKWQLIPVRGSNDSEWQVRLSEPIEIKSGNFIETMRVYLPLPKTNSKGKEMRLQVVPDCKACVQQTLILSSID